MWSELVSWSAYGYNKDLAQNGYVQADHTKFIWLGNSWNSFFIMGMGRFLSKFS